MSSENDMATALQGLHVNAYAYKPLARNQIRLLELQPLLAGDPDGKQISGIILTLSLDEAATLGYQALSYTWGPPKLSEKLKIQGNGGQRSNIYITEQLHSALLHLRFQSDSRRLWVDQICINQNDIQERGAQVQLMRDVYQKSNSTIAWLGEPKDADDLPVLADLISILQSNTLSEEEIEAGLPVVKERYPLMRDIPDLHRRHVQEDHDKSFMGEHVRASSDPECAPTQARRYLAVARLFDQPWFARAWIVQEVLVSQNLEVLYGPMNILFDMLDRLGSAVQNVILDTVGWLHALHNKTQGYNAFSMLTHANRLYGHDGCPAKNFLTFLFQMQETFTSTDSKDKIFAFSGLKKHLEPPVVLPDYSRNAAEVFADAAISFIRTSSTLDVLGLVEGNEKWLCKCQNQIPDLPSWAPNWTQKFHGVRPFYFVDFPNQFRSARGYKHEYVDSRVPGRLLVKGKQVASIQSLFPASFDGRNSYLGGLRNLIQLDKIMDCVPESSYKGDLKSALLRTLLADGGFDHKQPLAYSTEKILDVIDREEALKASKTVDADDSLKKVRGWSLILQRKRCFMADSVEGLTFGLGFFYVLPGDVVCVLYGSSVPFVLRPVGSKTGEKLYKAVGQCYLDGWMYGDYPLPKWWEDFETTPDEFTLV
ncbi:HET-domain-containing protein [Stipitochalara longipes BDJ]|nr:HET-domain-containing protein [Stipitochalara longipes BDJ]